MSDQKINDNRRVSARVVATGVVSTFAVMILFMALAGALGLWKFDLAELPNLGMRFWIWTFTAWIFSLFVGSFVAVISSNSSSSRDGKLHGFIIWASACVLGCSLIALGTGHVAGALEPGSTSILYGAVIGDIFAIAASVLGGLRGAKSEKNYEEREYEKSSYKQLKPAYEK